MNGRERKVLVRDKNNVMTFSGLRSWSNEDKCIPTIVLIKYSKYVLTWVQIRTNAKKQGLLFAGEPFLFLWHRLRSHPDLLPDRLIDTRTLCRLSDRSRVPVLLGVSVVSGKLTGLGPQRLASKVKREVRLNSFTLLKIKTLTTNLSPLFPSKCRPLNLFIFYNSFSVTVSEWALVRDIKLTSECWLRLRRPTVC